MFSLWFGSASTPPMTPPGSDSSEPRPRCFSLFVLLFNNNIFNDRSGDPLDGCGVFGVDRCRLVVNLLWDLLGVWLTVACGGFISRW